MAKAICFQATLVIFFCGLIVQNVHTHEARYHQNRTDDNQPKELCRKPSQFALCSHAYQKCAHGICFNSTDYYYPEKEILEVMQNTKIMQGLFGTVLNSTFVSKQIIDSRFGSPAPRTKSLCRTDGSKHTYQPEVLRSVDGSWKFVVNVAGFNQRFTAEFCSNDTDAPFRDFCRENNFKCKQNYQEVYLLTYQNKTIDYVMFELPTTCSCDCNGIRDSSR